MLPGTEKKKAMVKLSSIIALDTNFGPAFILIGAKRKIAATVLLTAVEFLPLASLTREIYPKLSGGTTI